MKTTSFLMVLLTLLVSLLPFPLIGAEAAPRLLVKWKDGPTSPAAVAGNAAIGSTVKRNFHALGWQAVELPPNLSLGAGIKAYLQLGTVLTAEPDGRMIVPAPIPAPSLAPESDAAIEETIDSTSVAPAALASTGTLGIIPNDPLFNLQWNMVKIGATNAWAASTGNSAVVVAILDTGVDYTHPDLAQNMWRNPGETGLDLNGQDKTNNGLDDDANGYVDDVLGVNTVEGTGDPMDLGFYNPTAPGTDPEHPFNHGTMIAGIIGAVGNNGRGVAGINWAVRLMAIRYIQANDADPALSHETYWSRYLAGWDYVIAMKRRGVNVRVASTSDGGVVDSLAVRDAIEAAGNEGILAVFSAGNAAFDQDRASSFPGAFHIPSALNVAASTEVDELAVWAAFGGSTVELAAPGRNITSTFGNPLYFTNASGSSFACPHVSGAAALVLSLAPTLTVAELKAVLLGSVDQPVSMRGKLVTHGRLNVARALEYLTNANPPAIVVNARPAGQWTPTNAPIQVTFSRPMDRATVESALVISPPVAGIFVWSDDDRSLAFHHEAPFNPDTNYTVRIRGSARDTSGGTLDGNYNRTRQGPPVDDFVWTFRFRIPNDDFANARQLVGTSGSIQASNVYAWTEVGEPAHVLGDYVKVASSVWFRWTAPEPAGWFTFDLTKAAAFDTLLAVYSGDELDHLVAVAGNDNYGGATNSRVSFATVPGTNYSIVVASKVSSPRGFVPNQSGAFNLAWYPTPPPVLTSFSPIPAYPGQKLTLSGTNFTGATRVLINGVAIDVQPLTNVSFVDLTITALVPDNATTGPITIETPHGNVTTSSNLTVLVLPRLGIRPLSGNLVEVSWPSTTGFNIQRSDTLGATTNWAFASSLSNRLVNGVRYLTLTNAVPSRFYRLVRP